MCEFCEDSYKNMAVNYFRSYPERLLTREVIEKFPYALQEACCPVCGRYLEEWERKPPGRATRSMCQRDYEDLIANSFSYGCFVCGTPLQDSKIGAQYQRPREVANHIHDGECLNRWAIIHNVALGEREIVAEFGDINSNRYLTHPDFAPTSTFFSPTNGINNMEQVNLTYKVRKIN